MLHFRTAGYNGCGIQYSPFYDNRIAVGASANYGLVGNGRLYDLSIEGNGQVRSQMAWDTQDSIFDVCWSELHENHVAAACGDGSIKLFDLTVPRFPVMNFKEHQKEAFSISWNQVDKSNFISSSWDGTVKVWDPNRKYSIRTMGSSVGLVNNTETLMRDSSKTRMIPLNMPSQSPNTSNCIYNAVYSPHSPAIVASCSGSSKVQVWDIRIPQSLQFEFTAHGGLEALSCDWNKYRPLIIASSGTDKSIRVWDLRTVSKLDSQTSYIPFPAYKSRGPAPVNELLGHEFAIRKVVWSPHEPAELLSASYDMTCRVWIDRSQDQRIPDLFPGGCKNIMNMHKEFATSCDYSLWGQPGWAASTGWDEMVYIWNTRS